jgi:hypothetical protein
MKTNAELFNRATHAGYDYKKVFGVYPEKIGIAYDRMKHFLYTSVNFPEMEDATIASFSLVDENWPTVGFHTVPFVPILGDTIDPDEVYLPDPKMGDKAFSGLALCRMVETNGAFYEMMLYQMAREVLV